MSLTLAFAAIGLAVTTAVGMREHAKMIASRRTLLDRCASLFSETRITHGGDGFPVLEGNRNGGFVRLELVPDSMTIRRLPQLWLKITCLESRPRTAEFSLLVRPSGAEFYSLTSVHPVILAPPAGVAAEMIAKGDRAESQAAIERSSEVLRQFFADPRTKEVAVTRKGLRLIWQAAEGHRGQHLVFRQCRFDHAEVDPSVLARLLSELDELGLSSNERREVRAA